MHPERGFLIRSCAGRGPAPNLEASLSLQEDPLRLRPRAASKGTLRGDADERRGNAQHGACETEEKWVKRPDAAGPGGGTLTLRASLFAL